MLLTGTGFVAAATTTLIDIHVSGWRFACRRIEILSIWGALGVESSS